MNNSVLNKQECDILSTIYKSSDTNQRLISKKCGHSLGIVNKAINSLIENKFLTNDIQLTDQAKQLIQDNKPKQAIILAAGFGMRMVPINTEQPKALLEVNGERLIERQIKQLHEVGIRKIYVVVGFMKESFEYLIDDYGADLVVNDKYSIKNNLYSLKLADEHLENCYIIPSDVWCDKNPFRDTELYSWYLVSDFIDEDSEIRVNRRMELVRDSAKDGNEMIGISYICRNDADRLKNRIEELCSDEKYDDYFWEEALYEKDRMFVSARIIKSTNVVEINTYEQLRELDGDSDQLKSDALDTIASVLHGSIDEITDISVIKKGMTNRSFVFTFQSNKYIMRIPGFGADHMVNRRHEYNVFKAIKGKGICDDPVFFNPDNGYKITKFLDNVRSCDCDNMQEVKKCMSLLKKFHNMKLHVDHSFDIFAEIDNYEKLWDGKPSVYRDYLKTKEHILSLKPYIDSHVQERVLTHIDPNPDNFLFYDGGLQLTDWEFAGMQDPHVDVVMFGIYSLYDRKRMEQLIDIYFGDDQCDQETRIKIYCYIACCGLLWSNWCEYKRNLGVEFGEYSLRQYHYAKDYYKIAMEEMEKLSCGK